MLDGLVCVDKPEGISSAKAISIIKRKFQVKKIGHAGTLDPMATGMLLTLVGNATRLSDLLMSTIKMYEGSFDFGYATDTDDCTGSVIETTDILPSIESIKKELVSFTGKIIQVPPNVSACKLNGVPAYKRTRRGETVSIVPREVEIFSFSISDNYELTTVNEKPVLRVFFKITCSKGTYIRSLGRDIALRLKSCACMSSLRRIRSGDFDVANAKTPDEVSYSDIVTLPEILSRVPSVNLVTIEWSEFLRASPEKKNILSAEFGLQHDISEWWVIKNDSTCVGVVRYNNSNWSTCISSL
jgi:tRNA pseudouridine55 synthase